MTTEAERENIRKSLAIVADLPTEEVATFHQEAKREATFWKQVVDTSEWELLRRLEEEGADKQVAGGHLITVIQPGKEYCWDVSQLVAVRPHLPEGEWEKGVELIPATYKVNTTRVKGWKKFGRRVSEIIEAAHTTRPRGNAKVEVETLEGEAGADIPSGLRGGRLD